MHYQQQADADQLNTKALYADANYLYVGTVQGLYAIKHSDLSPLPTDTTAVQVSARTLLQQENIWRIRPAQDTDDTLLLGSQNGLNRYDLSSQTTVWFLQDTDIKAVESSATVYSMAASTDGDQLWLMTAEDIRLFSRKQQQLQAIDDEALQVSADISTHWVGLHPANPQQLLLYHDFRLWAYSTDNQQLQPLYRLPKGYRQSSAYIEGVH